MVLSVFLSSFFFRSSFKRGVNFNNSSGILGTTGTVFMMKQQRINNVHNKNLFVKDDTIIFLYTKSEIKVFNFTFGRVQKNTKKKLTVVVEHNSHQNQARAMMLEQDVVYLKKSILRLKKNFQTLKDFFHECSSCSYKIYEIVCSANEESNNSLSTDFFLSEKTIPVYINWIQQHHPFMPRRFMC